MPVSRSAVTRAKRGRVRHHSGVDITVSSPAGATVRADARSPSRLLSAIAGIPLLLLAGALGAAAFLEGRGGFQGFVEQFHLFAVIVAVSFSALALVVARHQPGNAVAVVAAGISWGFALSYSLGTYGNLGLERGWPLLEWVVWVSDWVWVPALWAMPTFLLLRFPDGRLPARRWRIVELWTAVALGLLVVGWALTPYGEIDVAPLVDVRHPMAMAVGRRLYDVGFALALAGLTASLASFAWRFARSEGRERTQLKWALMGACATVLIVGSSVAVGPPSAVPASLGVALLPASIGFAVLRYRLWDVDLVINRSLTYGLTTVAILALYVATVATLGGALGRTTGAPLVATGLAALAVQPLRERAQRFANRLLYGEREDPYAALSRLGSHLAATGERERLLDGVTDAVVRALRLRGACISVDDRDVARVGDLFGPTREIPLTFRGEKVGALRVAVPAGEELRASDERLLTDLAHHVAIALHAERLHADLLASGARLVTAREEERRRIRRDLHDELGPTLAAVGLEIERASLELDGDAEALRARLEQATRRVRQVVGDIRGLVDGLRPAVLDELGLHRAVERLVHQLTSPALRVHFETEGNVEDLPAAVEVAAYRIVSEALTNVVRHAQASQCRITLTARDDALDVVIQDDGRGVGDAARTGVGLRSMRERATELGGRLTVSRHSQGGTRVAATVPVARA